MLKLSLYKSLILSHLTQPRPQGFSLEIWVFKGKPLGTRLHLPHCYLLWHFCNASDRRKLERIQERALRAVYKTRSASYQDLKDRAKLPMLYNTRGVRQDIATLMFKVKHSLVPVNTSDLFKLSITYEIVTSNCQDSKLLELAGIQ